MKIKLSFVLIILSGCLFAQLPQSSFMLNWSAGFGDVPGNDELRGSAVDVSGNVYATGRIDGAVDFDPGAGVLTYSQNGQCYISKYSMNGNLVWAKVLSGTGYSGGLCMGVDASNNVYVVGYFQGGDIDFDPGPGTQTLIAAQNDMFILCLDASGNFQWVKRIGQLSTSVQATNVKVTGAGDIHVTGYFNMNCDFDPDAGVTTLTCIANDVFVAKYNNTGALVWANSFGGSGTDLGFNIDVDATGDVLVTGQYEFTVDLDPSAGTYTVSSEGAEDIFVSKFNSAGVFLWGGSMGGPVKDVGTCARFASNGDLVVSAAVQSMTMDVDPGPGVTSVPKAGQAGANDMFLCHMSPTGSQVWYKFAGALVQPMDVIPYSFALDAVNNIVIAGEFKDMVDFDLNAPTYSLIALTLPGSDIFVAKYNFANADMYYAKQMGGGGSNDGNKAAHVLLYNSYVFLAGEHVTPADMDPGPATTTINSYGATDFFLARYTHCLLPSLPSISTTTNNVCAGSSATIYIISGTLNDAALWVWYTGGCGTTLLNTGTTIVVSPTTVTGYYVRGEGACVPNGGTCMSVSLTASPLSDISGAVTSGTGSPVAGQLVLFKYEPQFTKFDTTAKLTLGGASYSFTSTPPGNYLLMANPTFTNLQTTYSGNQTSWKSATPFQHGCSGTNTQNINVAALTAFTGTGSAVLSGKIVEGLKYGQKGAQVLVPGAPIKGISVKGGRNPGGAIGAQDRTAPDGTYTLSGLPISGPGESYFILVDVQGLDTNGTYHKVIVTGTEVFNNLDFVIDSAKVNPGVFIGVKETEMIVRKDIKVYPNPTSGKLYISMELGDATTISAELFDVSGRHVKTILSPSHEENGPITILSDNCHLSSGIYILELNIGGRKETIKIVKTE